MITQKKLENKGFTVTETNGGYEIQQYTPAGEDWLIEVGELEEFREYAQNFSPEEEFEMWYEAGRNGVGGVPAIPELWKDQMWKKKTLRAFL